jgi:hypothetical protein
MQSDNYMYDTYSTTEKTLHSAHTVCWCVLLNSYNKHRQFPRQQERVGITVGMQCVLCEVKGKVHRTTGHERPEGNRGIALLLF